ncbi:DUF1003 domain-containing protein [Acidithiobacillus albertensis]|uniref:DUF1003 domain-containing protein n=1 Tax=Acidithiobacillus albertensis TaxID=119978 RepID=UPI00094B1B03|nr:DUF1003 domain-containing protein [Acidithiobacillus albertensis]
MKQHSFLDRMALAAFTTPVMWGFFAFINLFLIVYVEWQEHSFHPFDSYPFVFLNLILAIFVAEMDVIIVIAQIVGSSKADEQTARTAELVAKTDAQTTLLVGMMESTLVLMRSLEDMGNRESERDASLHQTIKEGDRRKVVIERLVRELVEAHS